VTNDPVNVAFPVVGVGASAGGLEAFRKLLAAMPADTGIAFVLIPHLDPTHESMMVDLLGRDTKMKVVQAANGMPLERNCVYVIPPQAYLSVRDGMLRISQPQVPHGARLPFDFFLHSLADACGERAVCVILSGTGADGSVGLKAVSERGGLVIAQDPEEAAYNGMPRSAISTGAVNLILPAGEIPQALIRYATHPYVTSDPRATADQAGDGPLREIIELLRSRTSHDFIHYRRATLLRRIRRRMAAAGIKDLEDYLGILRTDGREAELLAKDFLIHVTSFFRDLSAFDGLARTVIPELVQQQTGDQPIRVWIPGCSTGEEAYTLAILFFEEFAAAKRGAKLQIFASDVSADAVSFGRNGLYPDSIKADVSAERLQRFFTRDDQSYRVNRDLRDAMVFTVQDLLADPPFSHLDLISCRNLLIYLQPEEQQKILSLFHFALREGGFLFLGASETIGKMTDSFEQISHTLRIFRCIGRGRPRDRIFAADLGERTRALWPRVTGQARAKRPDLREVAQQLLLDAYAPAAVLVDSSHQALYFFGQTDRYLRVPPGEPSQDIRTMLREGLAPRFRAAIRQASREHASVTVGGARVRRNGDLVPVSISARPVRHEDEELLLVAFVDEAERKIIETTETPVETSRVVQLEQELEDTRKELESTIHELEESNQELSAINEEALSVNEEFQSTNEELETSREELQSLNEELTTVNNQLQESLERQRRTSNDLQNILNSSDAATLFLDENLNIRFFTPSAASRFNLIASDVGRPLSDLANPFTGIDLLDDAGAVLDNLTPLRREVRSTSGDWYWYRTTPYRTQDNRIEGVVISLGNISELKAGEEQLRAARGYAEAVINTVRDPLIVLDGDMRVVSASRSFFRVFRASPSDTIGQLLPDTDARQLDVPALRDFLDHVRKGDGSVKNCEIEVNLEGLGSRTLVVTAEGVRDEGQITQRTLVTLNDITDFRRSEQQLAAAKQVAEQANLAKTRFLAAASHDLRQPLQTLTLLNDVLHSQLPDGNAAEFAKRAQETLDSMSGMLDALLDINQLEAGAIKPDLVDVPIGVLLDKLKTQFGYHASARGLDWRVMPSRLTVHTDPHLLEQMVRNLVSNAIRYTTEGKVLLGCRRHGDKLRIEVWDTGVGIAEDEIPRIFEEYHQASGQSEEGGLGLGLAIVERLGQLLGHPITVRSRLTNGSVFSIEVPLARQRPGPLRKPSRGQEPITPQRQGGILVIEDDPALREMLQLTLANEGYRTAAAANGRAALALVDGGGFRPDLIISDFILPGGMNGAQTAAAVRSALGRQVPVVYLTGDIRSASLRDLNLTRSLRLTKPVKQRELSYAVQHLLAAPPHADLPEADVPTIFVIDDDRAVRDAMTDALQSAGYRVQVYPSADAFLTAYRADSKGCVVTDVRMPGTSGFELLARLAAAGNVLPSILITGHGDVATAVEAMKAGAVDFIEKPIRGHELLVCIERALQHNVNSAERSAWRTAAAMRIAALTRRERDVMNQIVAGHANKEIAARLGIAQRTVETHRAKVMKKMEATSFSDLIRMVIAARSIDPSSS
jgi:two-component system CheB/CheR fusion protein